MRMLKVVAPRQAAIHSFPTGDFVIRRFVSRRSRPAAELVRLGAKLVDADRAGHEVLREEEVEQAIRNRWGDGVFDADGLVDRAAVAKIVFAPSPRGTEELQFLEQLTHPRITQRLKQQAAEWAARGEKLLVLDAAVMFKAGWDRMCDVIIFVDAPRQVRQERARRRGWREDEFAAREATQESLESKRQRADATIDNSGAKDQTVVQVSRIWRRLVS